MGMPILYFFLRKKYNDLLAFAVSGRDSIYTSIY